MLKRSIDIIFSAAALLVLLLVILLLCLMVWLEDRRNPLFMQSRYGKNRRIFKMFKIRTMSIETGRAIEDIPLKDKRITSVGKFLRAFHLDELPQLVNIIKGDMSLVGPRPLPVIMKVDGILNWEARSVIKPGVTGMAQLYCTKYTSLARKFHFDVLYVKRASLWLDFKLALATAWMIKRLLAFGLWTGVILLATLLPIAGEGISTIAHADKLVHFYLFAMMALAAVWFGESLMGSFRRAAWFCVLWGLLLAVGTEFAQSFLPLRNMSFLDFVADMIGVGYVVLCINLSRKGYEIEKTIAETS